MGAYDKFKDADPMGVRKFIESGEHILLVKRVEQSQSKNPKTKGVEKTIVEFKVVESTTMKKGEACSLVEMDNKQGYYGNVLSFVAGILGYTIDEMKKDKDFDTVFESVFGEEQILTDMIVHVVGQQVKTQAGGDYTAKTWTAIPSSEYEGFGLIAPDGAYSGEDSEEKEAA